MSQHETEFEVTIGAVGKDTPPATATMRVGRTRARSGGASGALKQPAAERTGVRPHYRKAGARAPRVVAPTTRRVIVKSRIVPHGAGARSALRTHVSYLGREQGGQAASPELGSELASESHEQGLGREVDYLSRQEQTGRALNAFYDACSTDVDARALTKGWADDVRHFRLIISPEDGADLGDLRPFVREVMDELGRKLGTRLEWVGVDHWDTDNPHSHVLVRGRRADGAALIIPNRLLTQGIREHAQEVATRVLGPRQEVSPELARRRTLELDAQRLTPLDREIVARSRNNVVALPERGRTDLIARLNRLENWNLAQRRHDGDWDISPELRPTLEAMGERQTVRRMLEHSRVRDTDDFDLFAADGKEAVLGRLVHVGLADEWDVHHTAVIEDEHGRLQYARFESPNDVALITTARPGAMVELAPRQVQHRPSDEAVARIAEHTGGYYSIARHAQVEPGSYARHAEANIRRLEAMRQRGLVARHYTGDFLIAPNHRDIARAFEAERVVRTPVTARIVSYWSLEEQIQAFAPTQLDRVLGREENAPEGNGRVSRDFQAALQQRRLFLIEQGLMGAGDQMLSRDTLYQLSQHERSQLINEMKGVYGVPVQTYVGSTVEGIYARRVDLAQGRVAILWRERSLQIVPWQPALEQFGGKLVQGQVRNYGQTQGLALGQGLGLDMTIGWKRVRSPSLGLGVSLPPM